MTEQVLDVDRVVRAGGFESDPEYGRRVVEILVATARIAVATNPSVDAQTLLDAVVAGVADELHSDDPELGDNAFWLSATHNAVADAYRDVLAQIAEARGLAPSAARQTEGDEPR